MNIKTPWYVLFLADTYWHGHRHWPHTCHRRKNWWNFMPTLRSFFSPSLGWPRQTEHVTTPALPSASSFSCHCSLIAEVIRLGKAALKIKVSHVSQHFCFDGYMWRLKATSIEAVFSFCSTFSYPFAAGRMMLERRMFGWFSLENQKGHKWEKKSTFFFKGVVSKWLRIAARKGISIISGSKWDVYCFSASVLTI